MSRDNYIEEMNFNLHREPQLLETYREFLLNNEVPVQATQGQVPNAVSEENSQEEIGAVRVNLVSSSNDNQQMDLDQQEYYENIQAAYNSSNSLQMAIEEKGSVEDSKENSTENTTESYNQISSQAQDNYELIPIQKWDVVKSEFPSCNDNSDYSDSDERLNEKISIPECNHRRSIEDINMHDEYFMNHNDETQSGTEGYPG